MTEWSGLIEQCFGDGAKRVKVEFSKLSVLPGCDEQKKKVVVAQALSDLVVYTGSVKFVSFSHSRGKQSAYENTSVAEKKARKLVKSSGETVTGGRGQKKRKKKAWLMFAVEGGEQPDSVFKSCCLNKTLLSIRIQSDMAAYFFITPSEAYIFP